MLDRVTTIADIRKLSYRELMYRAGVREGVDMAEGVTRMLVYLTSELLPQLVAETLGTELPPQPPPPDCTPALREAVRSLVDEEGLRELRAAAAESILVVENYTSTCECVDGIIMVDGEPELCPRHGM